MATGKSGSFSGTSSNGGYTLRVVWQEYYDIASNSSTISWTVYLDTKSKYNIYVSNKSGSVTINGVKYSFTASVSNAGGATTQLASGTSYSIAHNADGTKSISLSASWTSGISACGTLNASGSGTLTTIPRTSTVSATNTTMGGKCTITISRASSTFKHQLYFSFGDTKDQWMANSVDTSYSWTVPTSLASKIPNSTYGTCTITCITYSGNTKIGTSTTTCYLYVPSYSVTGTHTLTPIDQLQSKYVATKSKVKVVTAGATSYGASIKSYSTVVGSQAAQLGATITSNALSAGTISIKTTITDSRGKTGTVTSKITVIAYSSPYCIELHAIRDETNSEKVIVTTKFGVSSIDNANSISAVITVSGTEYPIEVSGYTYDGTVILNGINDEVLLTGTLTVTDVYSGIASEFSIPTLEAVMNFKANHKGVAFGGVSQNDKAVEMYWKLLLQDAENNQMVDVLSNLKGLSSRDYSLEFEQDGEWTYIKRSDGLLICFAIISYSGKTAKAWGSWYYIELGTYTYPVSFVSAPVCVPFLNAGFGGVPGFDGTNNGTKTKTPGLYVIRPTSASNANGSVAIFAIGKWK